MNRQRDPEGDSDFPPPPDRATFERILRGVLPGEEAEYIIREELGDEEADGWFSIGGGILEPITLGKIVLWEPFARWYVNRFPSRASLVEEIRGMPEQRALEQIRAGRWIEVQSYDSDGRRIS